MDVFVFVILITIIAGSIHLSKLWIRSNASGSAAKTGALEREVGDLRARVETLERIVTDDKYALDREIKKIDDD